MNRKEENKDSGRLLREAQGISEPDIDFIKWKVGYADGFRIKEKGWIETPDLYGYDFTLHSDDNWIDPISWKKIYHPLLLTRTIEGINRADTDWTIWTNQHFKKIYANWKDGNNTRSQQYPIGDNIDEAKEQALEYVYKQERGEK